METTCAIVMAAIPTKDPALASVAPNGCKSLIPIGGKPAVAHVLENLRECKSVSRIVLIADEPSSSLAGSADICIAARGDEAGCIIQAIQAAEGASRCLLMTGDMPLTAAEAIDDFLVNVPSSDVVYPIVEKSDVKAVFPDREAYYLGTRNGRFTGSSSILFRSNAVLAREKVLMSLLNARSDPKALVGMLGPGFAMRAMLGNLTISDFEQQLSSVLGLTCSVFISRYPEIVMSIDSLQDLALMERELG